MINCSSFIPISMHGNYSKLIVIYVAKLNAKDMELWKHTHHVCLHIRINLYSRHIRNSVLYPDRLIGGTHPIKQIKLTLASPNQYFIPRFWTDKPTRYRIGSTSYVIGLTSFITGSFLTQNKIFSSAF